jgi:hypothetical protein
MTHKPTQAGNATEEISSAEGVSEGSAHPPHPTSPPDNPGLGDPEFERQMEVAREVMRKHRGALRALAKM